MAYVHITRTPGMTMDRYHAVTEKLGDAAVQGRSFHAAGEAEGALVVVDVWESKADEDRFVSQRLFPAFEAARLSPMPNTEIITFSAAPLVGAAAAERVGVGRG